MNSTKVSGPAKTYREAKVLVEIPSLGIRGKDDAGNNTATGESIHVAICAMQKNDFVRTPKFVIGLTLISGYSETPYKHKAGVILPDGYEIAAFKLQEQSHWVGEELKITILNDD